MKHKSNNIKFFILILVLLAGLCLCTVASAEKIYSGSCGPNATWSYDGNGKLIISGTGEIEGSPWRPDHYDDIKTVVIKNGITNISESAFRNCFHLQSISIPNSVTRIDDTAFECCRLLSSVSFPSSVKSIGTSAFSECESLSSLTIPKTITSFGNAVFNKCTGIKAITFDGGIKNINFYSIFINCFGITAVNVPSDNTIYSSQNGVVFDKAMTTLLFYPRGKNGSYSIPAGITKVADSAFKQSRNLTSVKIPNSVKEIGLDAFRYCTNLKSISIPGSISEIKENTFHDCNLTNLVIPEGVKKIGKRAFYGNMEMKKLSLPHSLESIGEEAFYWTFLTVVNLHKNIRSIGDFAFDRSTPIYAPEGSYAAQWAQQNCYNYQKAEPEYAVTLQYTKDQGTASATPAYGTESTIITLKASPKKGFLFSGWTVVSGGVKIENNQFTLGTSDVVIKVKFKKDPSYASVKGAEYKLNKKKKTAVYLNPTNKTKTSITIPATINVDGVKYQVTEIAANAFKGCSKLKKVTIGKNITKIGKSAFKGCKKLATITIKTTKLTKKGIGSNCFKSIASKPTFKCPKKQKNDYKTWIVKTGKAPKKSKFK